MEVPALLRAVNVLARAFLAPRPDTISQGWLVFSWGGVASQSGALDVML
jgi:hypothetical protein